MKTSLITATYNSYPAINDCINSIATQTIKPEHIVIDAGSTDLTLGAVITSNVTNKYITEPDKGIYDALNKGIKLASGDVIGFLHSDDLLASSNIIEKIAETFLKTRADVVYGNLVYVKKKNTKKVIRHWKSKPFKKLWLYFGWMPAHPTVFIKREVYEKHGLFDLNFKIAADYDLMLRIFKDESLKKVYLPEVITRMRVGGASNKSIKNILIKSFEDYKAIKKNQLPLPTWILICKNLSKIKQFFN